MSSSSNSVSLSNGRARIDDNNSSALDSNDRRVISLPEKSKESNGVPRNIAQGAHASNGNATESRKVVPQQIVSILSDPTYIPLGNINEKHGTIINVFGVSI